MIISRFNGFSYATLTEMQMVSYHFSYYLQFKLFKGGRDNYLGHMVRCFVAIDLDEGLKQRISELQQLIVEPAIKLVEKENLHITLKFLGEISDDELRGVCEKLADVKSHSFEFSVSGMGAFHSNSYIRVVWVGIKDSGHLSMLAKKMAHVLPGFRIDDISPHVTIARARYNPEKTTEVILQNTNVDIGSQHAGCFILKKSVLTPKGPIYSEIKRFELL